MRLHAVMLDRDGVINVEGGAHILRPEDLRLLPGSADAIAALSQAGWTVAVFTNQSGVGRGHMSAADLEAVHGVLNSRIVQAGGRLKGIYACTHHPEAGCDCRKPKPGLLLQAVAELEIDPARSYAVGDSPRDIEAARAAGFRTVLVLSGKTGQISEESFPEPHPDHIFPNLSAFARWLLARQAPVEGDGPLTP